MLKACLFTIQFLSIFFLNTVLNLVSSKCCYRLRRFVLDQYLIFAPINTNKTLMSQVTSWKCMLNCICFIGFLKKRNYFCIFSTAHRKRKKHFCLRGYKLQFKNLRRDKIGHCVIILGKFPCIQLIYFRFKEKHHKSKTFFNPPTTTELNSAPDPS